MILFKHFSFNEVECHYCVVVFPNIIIGDNEDQIRRLCKFEILIDHQ